MKLHCLGTTGYHPSPTRHTACYYLPDLALLLDAGTGMFRIVERLLEQPQSKLTILLSHAHLDHVIGLTFLVDAMAVTALEQVRVIGEASKLQAVREHLYHDLLFPVAPAMEFTPLEKNSGSMALNCSQGNAVSLSWFPLEHPGGSLGFCISHGEKKLAYITDTTARSDAGYLSAIRGADLLLHECYFSDQDRELSERTGHSWLSAVTDVVRLTSPKQTALIHINPLAEILGGGVTLTTQHRELLGMFVAEDDMQIEI